MNLDDLIPDDINLDPTPKDGSLFISCNCGATEHWSPDEFHWSEPLPMKGWTLVCIPYQFPVGNIAGLAAEVFCPQCWASKEVK